MKRWLLFLPLAFAGAAPAQVTPELAAKFMEGQLYEQFPEVAGERIAVVPLLRAAPPGDPMSIVPALARKWNASESGAAKALEAILLDEIASRPFSDLRTKAMRQRISRLYHDAVADSPDSLALWKIGLNRIYREGQCDDLALRDAYLGSQFAQRGFPPETACDTWNIDYARRFPDSALARVTLHERLNYDDPAAELAAIRWALDALEARGRPDDLERAVRQWYWKLLANLGFGAELLADVTAKAASDGAAFDRPGAEKIAIDGVVVLNEYMLKLHAGAARTGWLLALLEAGRGDEARAAFEPSRDGKSIANEALFGAGEIDLFARYLENREESLFWTGFEVQSETRALVRVLASNGLESAARHLERKLCEFRGRPRDLGAQVERELAQLPSEFRAYLDRYRSAVAARDAASGCAPPAAAEALSTRLPRYAEVALTGEEKARTPLPALELKLSLPESFALVRAERRGDDVLALCESTAVDPAGEIDAAGYWLVRSGDGGRTWEVPRYLGLQSRSPYLAKREARLSMLAGDALRIEADVAELDPESITFPPVGLRSRRKVPDIRIDIPFAKIERDSDGDGWTDLLEAKLHTDPAKADTDGDGLTDPLDDFPQASARGTADPDAPLIVDLLKRIMGFERAGIVEPVRSKSDASLLTGMRRASAGSVLFQFVAGDPARFAGLRADAQVIVLTEEQLREIRATSGPFFPLEFPAILYDAKRERAIVDWSARWVGGTLLYRKVNGRWKGKEISSWITRVTSEPRMSPR